MSRIAFKETVLFFIHAFKYHKKYMGRVQSNKTISRDMDGSGDLKTLEGQLYYI